MLILGAAGGLITGVLKLLPDIIKASREPAAATVPAGDAHGAFAHQTTVDGALGRLGIVEKCPPDPPAAPKSMCARLLCLEQREVYILAYIGTMNRGAPGNDFPMGPPEMFKKPEERGKKQLLWTDTSFPCPKPIVP